MGDPEARKRTFLHLRLTRDSVESQKAEILGQLRAATSLARLWQQQERGQPKPEVNLSIAPVYNWFQAEGFEHGPDLIGCQESLLQMQAQSAI